MLKYRADVDGLRAIAVLLVLIFHGGIQWFPSGFIGVDIFFVISGYLISGIIDQSLRSGNFSFSVFYARRLWRLQPAMLAVFIVTIIIASALYLPADYLDFLKSAKYTSFVTSNQYFERTTTGYAVPDTAQLLLLHTWSLSIEWQWYLVLPAGLWLLNRYLSPQKGRWVLVVLTFAMLIAAMALSNKYPAKSYYFFTARVFEFLLGVCAATFFEGIVRLNREVRSIIGVSCIAVILYCATKQNILLGFPDYHAVAVCAATALLLMIGSDAESWSSKVLSWRPLVFVGTLSYSLYLWHWPVFAVGRYLNLDGSVGFTIVCFVITLIIAHASYVLVEKKFRKTRLSIFKSLVYLVALPALCLTVLYSLGSKYEGMPGRFGGELTSILTKLKESEAPYRQSCLGGTPDGSDSHCVIGELQSDDKSLLIGDSFSNQYWGFMDVLGKDAGTSILVQGTSSCLALPNTYLFDWWNFKNSIYAECHDNVASYYNLIKTHHYKFVAIGQMWSNYDADNVIVKEGDERSVTLSRARVEAALDEAMHIIVESGARPIIVKSTFVMPDKFQECFYRHIKLRRPLQKNECLSASQDGRGVDWFDALFDKTQKKYPTLVIIDPKYVQCGNGSCMTSIEGVPVYRDVGHITDFASYKFGRKYLEKFSNPLLQKPELAGEMKSQDSKL